MPNPNESAPTAGGNFISRYFSWFLEPFICEIKSDFDYPAFQQRFGRREEVKATTNAAIEAFKELHQQYLNR